jgi:DNA-binding transcriptional LysR family regulator
MDRLLSMRVFQKVIDEGGFAAAARALEMSPAVVTRLVADLEAHLGTRLLHRTTRRLSLSVAGETYLARVRNILEDIDEAHNAASSQTASLSGVLRVLAPPVIATHLIGEVIGDFRKLYPRIWIDLEVASLDSASLDTSPIEAYDVTLLPAAADFDGDIIARKISSTEAVIVCSPQYAQMRGIPATPDELIGHEVLRLKVPGQRRRVWRLYDANDNDRPYDAAIEPGIWANHNDTLLRAALVGAGITSIAVDLAAPYLSSGQLLRVLRPWITGHLSLYAALPSRKFMPERTRVFVDFLAEQIRIHQNNAVQACQNC